MLIDARMDITPAERVTPPSAFTWRKLSQLSGLPGPAERTTRLGWVPHLSCERDQEKGKIVWREWLPHRGGVPHVPGGPPLP